MRPKKLGLKHKTFHSQNHSHLDTFNTVNMYLGVVQFQHETQTHTVNPEEAV